MHLRFIRQTVVEDTAIEHLITLTTPIINVLKVIRFKEFGTDLHCSLFFRSMAHTAILASNYKFCLMKCPSLINIASHDFMIHVKQVKLQNKFIKRKDLLQYRVSQKKGLLYHNIVCIECQVSEAQFKKIHALLEDIFLTLQLTRYVQGMLIN